MDRYDIAATGQYDGFRKLMNHKMDQYFDVCFSFGVCGGKFTYEVKVIQIKHLNGYLDLTQEVAERAVKRIAERYIERTYEPEDSFKANWKERWLNPR